MMKRILPILIGLILITSLAWAGLSTGNGAMSLFTTSEVVTDNSTISLPDATNGLVWLSDGTNAALTHVSADGSVLEMAEAGTVEVTDTGSTLAIYDDGTQAIIKNKSGSNSTVTVIYQYVQ